MKKKRFSVEQIIGVLKQAQVGVPSVVAAIDDDDPHTINVRYPTSLPQKC